MRVASPGCHFRSDQDRRVNHLHPTEVHVEWQKTHALTHCSNAEQSPIMGATSSNFNSVSASHLSEIGHSVSTWTGSRTKIPAKQQLLDDNVRCSRATESGQDGSSLSGRYHSTRKGGGKQCQAGREIQSHGGVPSHLPSTVGPQTLPAESDALQCFHVSVNGFPLECLRPEICHVVFLLHIVEGDLLSSHTCVQQQVTLIQVSHFSQSLPGDDSFCGIGVHLQLHGIETYAQLSSRAFSSARTVVLLYTQRTTLLLLSSLR